MKRILLIGSMGSGKTTLAIKLSQLLAIPVVHLDKLYWKDNWERVDRQEFDRSLKQELEKEKWIIDGNFIRTMPERLKYCDTVIFLDYGKLLCTYGVLKRVFFNYGKSRFDMGGNCPERIDMKFIKDVWNFQRENHNKIMNYLGNIEGANIVILKNRKESNEYINGIEKNK